MRTSPLYEAKSLLEAVGLPTMSLDRRKGLEWTALPLNGDESQQRLGGLLVSNPAVPLPDGLLFQQYFVRQEEEDEIVQEIEQKEFAPEGFDQRRRVQRYSFFSGENAPPPSIVRLRDRLKRITGHEALHVVVEEYSPETWSRSGEYASNQTVATFESNGTFCSCRASCRCSVAQIPLKKAGIQHLNKPRRRQANCWNLESSNHWTDVYMGRGSLLVKTDDCLWNWRSRLAAAPACSDTVYILKLYTLPRDSSSISSQVPSDEDCFGYRPSDRDRIPLATDAMPPLEDLLTIIITTSPIKSNPSTELLERAMDTFVHGGLEFAYKCRKVIVCDGCRTKDAKGSTVSRKHGNAKQAMRNGIVTSEQGERYEQYKANVRAMCENAPDSSPFHNAVVEELEERHGYGFALRHALRHRVSTSFVCVVQHDRTFMRTTPIRETIETMWRHPGIKYVGMSMRSNLLYRDIFLGKYGGSYQNEFKGLVKRPPELKIHGPLYGPNSVSTESMVYASEKLRNNIQVLAGTYRGSAHFAIEEEWREKQGNDDLGYQQLSLTPTLFWYDNVHICETEHYRDFVFDPTYKMVARGGFVEDKLSPVLKRTVERLGLRDGHSRFGCYLLDDHSGMFFTGHLDGGAYITTEERKKLRTTKNGWSSYRL